MPSRPRGSLAGRPGSSSLAQAEAFAQRIASNPHLRVVYPQTGFDSGEFGQSGQHVASEIVTVCLDGVDGRDYVEALAAVLARYDEKSDEPRWESQWRISSDGEGLPLPAGRPKDDEQMLFADGVCVGGPRSLLNLDGAWAASAAAAGRLWDTWQAFADGYPKARSLEDLYSESAADPARYTSAQAEADYRAQPLVVAALFLADGESTDRGAVVLGK